jgi:hypothetical protein
MGGITSIINGVGGSIGDRQYLRNRTTCGGGFSIEIMVRLQAKNRSKVKHDTFFSIPCEELIY